MKEKLSTLILPIILVGNTFAQDCSSGRYLDTVFSSYNLTSNIQYGQNIKFNGTSQNLLLDVYQPSGDTMALRPLIIFACGGNFLTSNKTQGDVVPLCKDLAKRGYVTASILYRVGMEDYPLPGPDSADAADAVFRATHDARAAVRFFRKDVAESGNTYGIDTSRIFFGGSSAGGFMALHLAYLDDISEKPSYIDTTQAGMGGGIEGNTGNAGYSSKVTAIINISGALGDTTWMKAGDTPVLSFHGDQDDVVPFGSAMIILVGVYPLLTVDGSESVHIQADKVGINNCFKPYYGAGHTPHWGGHPGEVQYLDTTLAYIRNFLGQFVCGVPSVCSYTYDTSGTVGLSEREINKTNEIIAYPNPTNNSTKVRLKNYPLKEYSVELYDRTGKLVRLYKGLRSNEFEIPKGELTEGLYLINIVSYNVHLTGKVLFE